MISSAKENLANICKSIAPGFITVFLIIIASVNVQIQGISSFIPMFSVMSVFFWSVYWPEIMPKWFVFFVGIFQDSLYGNPALGLTSLLLLILWGVIVSQRRYLIKEPFPVVWLMFSLSLSLYLALNWLAYIAYSGIMVFSPAMIMQLVISIALYPVIHKIFSSIYASFLHSTSK